VLVLVFCGKRGEQSEISSNNRVLSGKDSNKSPIQCKDKSPPSRPDSSKAPDPFTGVAEPLKTSHALKNLPECRDYSE
jgi:hypothetical protein